MRKGWVVEPVLFNFYHLPQKIFPLLSLINELIVFLWQKW